MQWTRCRRCGINLTDEESQNAGYGPECITKVDDRTRRQELTSLVDRLEEALPNLHDLEREAARRIMERAHQRLESAKRVSPALEHSMQYWLRDALGEEVAA